MLWPAYQQFYWKQILFYRKISSDNFQKASNYFFNKALYGKFWR